jgi:hypothetical protein
MDRYMEYLKASQFCFGKVHQNAGWLGSSLVVRVGLFRNLFGSLWRKFAYRVDTLVEHDTM